MVDCTFVPYSTRPWQVNLVLTSGGSEFLLASFGLLALVITDRWDDLGFTEVWSCKGKDGGKHIARGS